MINNIDSNYSNDKTNADVAIDQLAEAKRLVKEIYEIEHDATEIVKDSINKSTEIARKLR